MRDQGTPFSKGPHAASNHRAVRCGTEKPGSTLRRMTSLGVTTALVALASTAAAQPVGQPPPPPPGFEQQPMQQQPMQQQPMPQQPPPPGGPGYYPPPPGYGYGYGAPVGPMLGPKKMDYEDGDPVPPGYHVETKMKKGLFIAGTVTFGATYLFSALTAGLVDSGCGNSTSSSCSTGVGALYVPVVGPFIGIGTMHSSGSGTFVLVIDGIAQAGGVAMAIAGLALDTSELVRNDVGKVHVTPWVAQGVTGLGLSGSL